MTQFRIARSETELEAARELMLAYAASLDFDLSFQSFTEELNQLPGKYDAPRGRLYLAIEDSQPIGCIAVRPFDDRNAELKRLWVAPSRRGKKLGWWLSVLALAGARNCGYEGIFLDTIDDMLPAIGLYERLGFERTDPYTPNPIDGALYFFRSLTKGFDGHAEPWFHELRVWDAVIHQLGSVFDELFADSYLEVTADGNRVERGIIVEESPAVDRITGITINEPRSMPLGDDTWLLSYRLEISGTCRGKELDQTQRWTQSTWHRGSRWQCYSFQQTYVDCSE